MKIRWTQSSVRFRITPRELETLLQSEIVQEALKLPGGSWSAAILPGSADTDLSLVEGDMLLSLSTADRTQLADPETEGVYFQTDGDKGIRFCIEKDFPCAHPRVAQAMEPQTETFPTPPGFNARKTDRSPSSQESDPDICK